MIIVIYLVFCLDVAQGHMNGAQNIPTREVMLI